MTQANDAILLTVFSRHDQSKALAEGHPDGITGQSAFAKRVNH